MSNWTGEELYCPLLQRMREHSLNNNTKVNLAVVCFHSLFSGFGILENALILWVVGFRLRRRTVASIWVLNLAMSDFLTTLTLPFFTFYFSSAQSWELGNPLCKIQASIFFINMFVSAFLLAAISLDRLLMVIKPVWSQNHRTVAGVWKVCALGWLWAAINTVPYTIFRSVTHKNDGRNLCYHNFALISSSQATLERDCKVRQATTAISKLLFAFLVPLVVIAASYIQIGLNLRKRGKKRKQSTSRLTDALIVSKKDKEPETTNTPTLTKKTSIFLRPMTSGSPLNLSPTMLSSTASHQISQDLLSQSFIKMVTFVITAFVLCWAPYHIFCVIEVIDQYRNNDYLVEVGMPLVTTIAFLNPVLNPILYAFSCPHFCVRIRQSLGAVFDGLVEEGGGLLLMPGKSLRAQIRRRSSRDVNLEMPGSPKVSNSHRKSDDNQAPVSPSLSSEGLKNNDTDNNQKETVM